MRRTSTAESYLPAGLAFSPVFSNKSSYNQKQCFRSIISGISTSKAHWNSSRPHLVTRKDPIFLTSTRLNFEPCKQKIAAKFIMPSSNFDIKHDLIGLEKKDETSNCRDENSQKASIKALCDKLSDYSISEKNAFKTFEQRVNSSLHLASPAVKEFRDEKRNRKKVASAGDTTGLSVVSSPAPIQLRVDTFVGHRLAATPFHKSGNLNR